MQALEDQQKADGSKVASAKGVYAAINDQREAAMGLLARIQGLWDRAGELGEFPHMPTESWRGLSSLVSQSTGSKRGALPSPDDLDSG